MRAKGPRGGGEPCSWNYSEICLSVRKETLWKKDWALEAHTASVLARDTSQELDCFSEVIQPGRRIKLPLSYRDGVYQKLKTAILFWVEMSAASTDAVLLEGPCMF